MARKSYFIQGEDSGYWPITYIYWSENYSPLVLGIYYAEIYRITQIYEGLLDQNVVLNKYVLSNVILSKLVSANVILSKIVAATVALETTIDTTVDVVDLIRYDELERNV